MLGNIGIVLKLIVPAFKGIFSAVGFIKPLMAGKSAAEGRELRTLPESTFDDVLRRLTSGSPEDSLLRTAYESLKTMAFTPDFLRTDYVKEWLSQGDVVSDLRAVVLANLNGSAEQVSSTVNRLEVRYSEITYASITEATGVVSASIAMLVATINASVKDAALASIVLAQNSQVNGFQTEMREDMQEVKMLLRPTADSGGDDTPLSNEIASKWRLALDGASSSLLQWPTVLGNKRHIPRLELSVLLEKTRDSNCAIALLGLPGAGKSALLASLGKALLEIPNSSVLAIKGDFLSQAVSSEFDLQRELALPELPEVMLRKLAAIGPTFLLIDQLDALAGHLDLKSSRLNVLLNLARAVGNVQNVFVFVSCRKFEFEHDVRLSRLDIESVELSLPEWEEVLSVLDEHGISAAGWNSDAKEVMRVPQQLAIYMQLHVGGVSEPFSNYTAMLDRLWTLRVLEIPGGENAARLAFEIAETMAGMEELWLAAGRFDDRIDSLKLLLAPGILTKNGKGAIGFSHQTVFEHILARSFAKQTGGLSSFVLARTVSLFVRPKLWAGLAYLRDAEPQTYLSEFSTIWRAPNVRKHLLFLLVEFLGSQLEPMDREDDLLVDAFSSSELQALVLGAIVGSPGWFVRFEPQLRTAMRSQNLASVCIPVLNAAWQFAPLKVVGLLREVWFENGAYDKSILIVLEEAREWTVEVKHLAIEIARRMEQSPLSWDYFIGAVGGVDPEFAVDLLFVLLHRFSQVAVEDGLQRKIAFDADVAAGIEADVVLHLRHRPTQSLENMLSDSLWSTTPSVAEASPTYFLETLWTWYLNVFHNFLKFSSVEDSGLVYPLRYPVNFRFEDVGVQRTGHGSILDAIVYVVEDVAKFAPSNILAWAKEQYGVELAPVQRLVAHAFTQAPEHTSSEALEFLLADYRRFYLGSIIDSSSTTTRLITECAPFWTEEQINRFAKAITLYSPKRPLHKNSPDEIRNWQKMVSRTRILLLRALPEATRTPEIKRAVQEGYRILKGDSRGEKVSGGGWVGSPMEATQFERASIENIVNAFKVLPDETGWEHPKHFMQGGNIQLSREFAEFSKKNPRRALDILRDFKIGDSQRAAGYAIYELAGVCDPDSLIKVILDLAERGFQEHEFKQQVALAVDSLLNRSATLPDSLVTMLDDWIWIFHLSNSGEQRTDEASGGQGESEHDSDKFLLSGHRAIETLPGGAYLVLSTTLKARYQRGELGAVVQTLRRYLSINKDTEIWRRLARDMDVLAFSEVEGGKELIASVLSLPGLDGTDGAATLILKAYRFMPDQVLKCLLPWRDSLLTRTQRGYGELVALIALTEASAAAPCVWLDELISEPHMINAREGAAATAVHILWAHGSLRNSIVNLLMRLLGKHEEAIWHLAFHLFHGLDAGTADAPTIRLIDEIAERINFAPAPKDSYVVECLAGFVPRHAKSVAAIAAQLIQLWRNDLSDMRTSIALASREIIDLAITLHRLDETREQGIQMFEQLVEIGAHESRQVLNEIDNRLRIGQGPLRPRLSRIRRRSTKRVGQLGTLKNVL